MSRARLFAVRIPGRIMIKYYAAVRPGVVWWWHAPSNRWRWSNFEFAEELVARYGADCVRFLGMAKELKNPPKFASRPK